MIRLPRTLLVASAAAVTVGCASSGTTAQTGEPRTTAVSSAAPRQRRDPNVITEAELATKSALTARQAVEQLRPQFLRIRGTTTLGNAQTGDMIWVYFDGTRMGGVEVLNTIGAFEVREIRYLSPAEATNRYGTGHVQGVILVTRK